jgi:hypothetical protein
MPSGVLLPLAFKYFRDIPLYFPAWTSEWHDEQRGTCLRLMAATFWSNALNFGLIVLMCLMWCISTSIVELQLAQGLLKWFFVLIFHFKIAVGSGLILLINFIGSLFSLGQAKSILLSLPLLLLVLFISMDMLVPNFR